MNWRAFFSPFIFVFAGLKVLIGWLLIALAWTVDKLFGEVDWTPPSWWRWILAKLSQYKHYASNNKKKASLQLALPLLLLGAGWAGWLWYDSLPKPVKIDYVVEAPTNTQYFSDRVQYQNLTVQFQDSVVPLDMVDKSVDIGVTLTPQIKGKWKWEADRRLRFTPQEDWKIGATYTLTFAKEGLLAEHVLLSKYEAEFTTSSFALSSGATEFFQDPVDPTVKKMITTLRFTHPVDAVSLERNLSQKPEDGLEFSAGQDKPFSVSYSDTGLIAYVHSARIEVPKISRHLSLSLAKGVKAKAGSNESTQEQQWSINVPGRGSLSFQQLAINVVDKDLTPVQVLQFDSSAPVTEKEINQQLQVWLLPKKNSARNTTQEVDYWSISDVSQNVLNADARVPLTYQSGEFESSHQHALTLKIEPGRFLYVKFPAGVKAVGGYESIKDEHQIMQVPAYPRLLKFMSEGSLLSLKGEQKIAVVSRGVKALTYSIRRIVPDQLHHYVDDNGHYLQSPYVNEHQLNRVIERFSRTVKISDPDMSKAQISELDLGQYLNREGAPRGVFVVSLKDGENDSDGDYYDNGRQNRLIMLTDLGMIVKKNKDGDFHVYVMSLSSGKPVQGIKAELVGRNGIALVSETTDANGQVFVKMNRQWTREKQPLMFVAKKENDSTFLPFNGDDRELNYSRFDVGGEDDAQSNAQLSAYAFSDRDLYRPGDTVRLLYLIRSADWKTNIAGVPLKLEIMDPRGMSVWKGRRSVHESGFDAFEFATEATFVTGEYNLTVSIERDRYDHRVIGATSFTVREFEPDRLKVRANLAEKVVNGWLTPEQVKALVNVQHLFGNPAAGARVVGNLGVRSASPYFAAFKGYQFYDPERGLTNDANVSEPLGEALTDDQGNAAFDLNLKRFDKATYRVDMYAQAFEKGSGRGVSAQSSVLVSSAKHLIGVKADGDLNLRRQSERTVHWQAVNSDLAPVAVENLLLDVVERRYVSVLSRQDDGTYRYVSRSKDNVLSTTPVKMAANGLSYRLDSNTPGDFELRLRSNDGSTLSRLSYSVAGNANLTRSLERNAELKIKLDKSEYRPGETIEVDIVAPYIGSGLITIERDKVYAQQWFTTTTTSSTQRIELPKEVEGNAYINVQFVRDMQSDEVFMSPLSYGVAPFTIDKQAKTLAAKLTTPELVRPGHALSITLNPSEKSRVVLVAVDEGILQVAKFKTPDPIAHFFRKRRLQVDTRQLLDLVLPEFSRLLSASAPGGDAESLLAQNLNPFKKKRQPPVVWWSGVQDVEAGENTYSFEIPDYFNGRVRVYAVLANEGKLSVQETNTKVQGEIILTPTVPAAVSPGDELVVSLGVYNNIAGSGSAPIRVRLKTSDGASVLGESERVVDVSEGKDQLLEFRLKMNNALGEVPVEFEAESGAAKARYRESVSLRPASPYRTDFYAGTLIDDKQSFDTLRQMYPEFRESNIAVSASPLIWASGLSAYLGGYSHACTEQLTSRAIPALILTQYPELLPKQGNSYSIADAIRVLRSRQNDSGGFGMWTATPDSSTYVSLYAMQFLLEARDRNENVPEDMLRQVQQFAQNFASRGSDSLWDLRQRAYAIYLLARSGKNVNSMMSSLRADLEKYFPQVWLKDLSATYLAAAMQLQKQNDSAWQLMKAVPWAGMENSKTENYLYHDGLTQDAVHLYLLAAHFPARIDTVPEPVLRKMGEVLSKQHYHTHSASQLLLALGRYHEFASANLAEVKLQYVDANGKKMDLSLKDQKLLKSAEIPMGISNLRVQSSGKLPVFYSLTQTGFDQQMSAAQKNGMEIFREFVDLNGTVVESVTVGQEFTVRLRFRALQGGQYQQIAIVDLLPGGVEPVPMVQESAHQSNNDCSTEECDQELHNEERDYGDDNHHAQPYRSSLGVQSTGDWYLDYDNVRDDRVVLYGGLRGSNVSTMSYRVRAVSPGKFVVPVSYAEAMYDRTMYTITADAKQLVIEKP